MNSDSPELYKTVEWAIYRCFTVQEILDHILKQIEHIDTSIIKIFNEKKLTLTDHKKIIDIINKLNSKSENIKPHLKFKTDRVILRLLKLLPLELSGSFASKYFKHSLKNRRKLAYSTFRNLKLDIYHTQILFNVYNEEKEQEALELIVKNSEHLSCKEIKFLLTNLHERYWRVRAIERLLVDNRSAAIKISHHYPYEYAHAVGRTMDISLLDSLLSLFSNCSISLEIGFLKIYAYALGKLQAKNLLSVLQNHITENQNLLYTDCNNLLE